MTPALQRASPNRLLRLGAVVLPVLKCALCPACLSIWGSLLAGARLGFVEGEGLHGLMLVFALVADFAILGFSWRHHRRWGPLSLCSTGAFAAALGHFFTEPLEYAGFAMLLAAGLWNMVLLRRHHQAGGECCAHGHHHHQAPAHHREQTA